MAKIESSERKGDGILTALGVCLIIVSTIRLVLNLVMIAQKLKEED
ncbi:MAG: hypothetical protein LUH18_03740 [Oscillospiraceae bacterium]|nr:hypothetical protein [Oscillospiraceae bacterium]